MQQLTQIAIEKANGGIFSRTEVACWVDGSPERQYSLLKRAMGHGEVNRIHRGLYCLASRFLRRKLDPLALAQRIHGPSYLSLETALSCHGWIPEAVYSVTSVSLERSRQVDSPLGHFSYNRVPQKTLYAEVDRMENNEGKGYLLASPLKAMADYVYVHKCEWRSAQPLIESLRIDPSLLTQLKAARFDRNEANYHSRRVQRFLHGLRKELDL